MGTASALPQCLRGGRLHRAGRPPKRWRGVREFDALCRIHGYIMLVFGVSVFFNCVIERTPSLQWLTGWGFRLNMLYSEADGTNPAVNAVYRVLAICMLAIGLYEIKLPELDERVKEYYSKVFVMYLLPVGLCFGYDAIQPYAGPLSVCVAAVPLFFSMVGLYILLRRR